MRRLPVPFPLPFCLFAAAHPFGAGPAVFGPVGFRRKCGPALTAAFHFVPVFRDLGVQGRVQREDGGPEPPAQERIGNALHTNPHRPAGGSCRHSNYSTHASTCGPCGIGGNSFSVCSSFLRPLLSRRHSQNAVHILLDDAVFLHLLFRFAVLFIQPFLFLGQPFVLGF